MSSEPNTEFKPIHVFTGAVDGTKVTLITEPGLTLKASFEHAVGIDSKDRALKLRQIITGSIKAAGGKIITSKVSDISPTFQVMPGVGKDILPTVEKTFKSLAEKTVASNFETAYQQVQTDLAKVRGR